MSSRESPESDVPGVLAWTAMTIPVDLLDASVLLRTDGAGLIA